MINDWNSGNLWEGSVQRQTMSMLMMFIISTDLGSLPYGYHLSELNIKIVLMCILQSPVSTKQVRLGWLSTFSKLNTTVNNLTWKGEVKARPDPSYSSSITRYQFRICKYFIEEFSVPMAMRWLHKTWTLERLGLFSSLYLIQWDHTADAGDI